MIPEQAYTAVTGSGGGSRIGLALRGFTGYSPCPEFGVFGSYDEATVEARRLNSELLGIEEEKDAVKLVLSTMQR